MAQRANGFRTNYPAQGVLPSGALLNNYGGALNALLPGYPSGHAPQVGMANLSGTEAGLIVGVATITGADDSCPTEPNGETGAPCGSIGLYSAVFRYRDADDGEWEDLQTELRIDAAAYRNQLTGQGALPVYAEGDSVPAYFDPRRQWCIPIQSPPDYPSAFAFAGQANVGVTRATPGFVITPNAVEVSLELYSPSSSYSNFGWAPLSPRLILKPDGKEGAESGGIVVTTTLRHYELLRLRCGTSQYSRAELQVARHGMTVRFLAPTPNFGAGLPDLYGGTAGFVTLPGLTATGVSLSRFKDTPTVTSFGDYLRVEMGQVDEEWLAEITIWAEARQSNLNSFVLLKHASGDSEGADAPDGGLVEPNDDGLHDGIIIEDIGLEGIVEATRNMKCWLLFLDHWSDDTIDGPEGKIVGEQNKIYGPCEYLGHVAVEGDDRPVYGCNLGLEEYIGKAVTAAGTTKKGTEGRFYLLDGKKRNQGIIRTCKADYNDIDNTKYVLIKRQNQVLIVNPLEC